ncbi:MAG: hypothetical protein M3Y83_15695, partial [Actinomycetota bacterium]|nr:hypothetical protein [Actinomycetota bacterium]
MQSRGAIVLVVDDAHLLDPLSATLVHQLALTGDTPLLLTVRSHETVPDAVSKLWTDELLTRIAVEPFSEDDCRRLVDDMLEAPAEDHAHAYFWSESRGNPLLLRHLVEASAEQGLLVRVGRFCVLTDRPAISAELSEIIELRLTRLDHAAREVLEVLALGGLIDLDVLAAMCSDPAVEAAERSGFARVIVERGRTKVQVSHPLVEQVLVALMPVTTRRRIAARLAAVLDEIGESGITEQVRKALLVVESDVRADATQLIDAAQHALTLGQVGLGERLARHAVDHGGGLPAALALGQALSWQGRGDDAEALLARCETDETDPQQYIRWVCARAANLFWVCGQPADAEALLRQCMDRRDAPAMLDSVRALRASFAFYRGDLAASIGCGSRVLASPTAPPLAQVWVASALTQAFAEVGQFEQAQAAARQGRLAAEQCSSGLHRFAVGYGQSAAKIAEGEFAAAGEICREYRELAMGEPLAEAIVDIMAGRLLMFRGRLLDSHERLRSALSTVRIAGLRGWVMVAGSSLAFVESQLGWTEAADDALRVARAADGAHVAIYRIDLRIAEARWAAAVGELSSAVQAAREAAACARDRQMFSTEARALSVAT